MKVLAYGQVPREAESGLANDRRPSVSHGMNLRGCIDHRCELLVDYRLGDPRAKYGICPGPTKVIVQQTPQSKRSDSRTSTNRPPGPTAEYDSGSTPVRTKDWLGVGYDDRRCRCWPGMAAIELTLPKLRPEALRMYRLTGNLLGEHFHSSGKPTRRNANVSLEWRWFHTISAHPAPL